MTLKRPLSPSSSLIVYESSPIEDRSSRFIAIYSPSLAARDLQARPEFNSATHRIAAWRVPSSQRALSSQRLFDTRYDDDGEKYGGKALASVLDQLDVEGAVVVARWYGGVMLGPVRFDHIRHCAREAVDKYIDRSVKKAKIVEDEGRRKDLIRILPEWDQSISVLRALLLEKQVGSDSATSRVERKDVMPAKVPDYTKLPLPALENLERARDATIGWILGQIEKAESLHQGQSDAMNPPVERSKETVEDSEKSPEAESQDVQVPNSAA
ncbi:MAG: hypothetical protein Q9166_007261 [cf. Caloplaca sp. 2 TL-2023]